MSLFLSPSGGFDGIKSRADRERERERKDDVGLLAAPSARHVLKKKKGDTIVLNSLCVSFTPPCSRHGLRHAINVGVRRFESIGRGICTANCSRDNAGFLRHTVYPPFHEEDLEHSSVLEDPPPLTCALGLSLSLSRAERKSTYFQTDLGRCCLCGRPPFGEDK